MKNRKIYIILFLILYVFVALVSGIHGFAFFGLANTPILAVMLAVAFEIGQAAVLFSILTDKSQHKKFMPWVLMIILTLVQVMGNVYNCYRYLLLNAGENLQFFKEPIFIWTQLPDEQANVILSYIQGAILPIVALLLTSMVTGFLNRKDDEEEEIEYIEEEPEEDGEKQLILEDDKSEEIPLNDIEEKNDEYVENLPDDNDYKEEEEVKENNFEESKPIDEIIENLPKNENNEIIGTDMEDDGSLIGEPGQDGSKILNEEKPEESKFINI